MESFSNFLLGRNEFGSLKYSPPLTVAISQKASALLRIWHCTSHLPPGLGTVQEHLAQFSGALFCCYSDCTDPGWLSPVEIVIAPNSWFCDFGGMPSQAKSK